MPTSSQQPNERPLLRTVTTLLAVVQVLAGGYVIFDGFNRHDWTLVGIGFVTATMSPGWYALARSRRPPVT